ncbi:MAG: hypothetical protein LBS21_10775 [Clostridiales bacterium]|jgi:hypothetical protein|nr:hypothetical protein [Clostridiales bacterium]
MLADNLDVTHGYRDAPNIVLSTIIRGSISLDDIPWTFGLPPIINYQPKYSAFKVGQGSIIDNTIDDYEEFQLMIKFFYDGVLYSEKAKDENISKTMDLIDI